MKRILLIACICSIPLSHTFSQINKADTIIAAASELADYILYQNYDSSYIRSYADKVSVKILALNKFNTFHLWDQSLDGSISYRPDLGYKISQISSNKAKGPTKVSQPSVHSRFSFCLNPEHKPLE